MKNRSFTATVTEVVIINILTLKNNKQNSSFLKKETTKV